jgi:hypothetical protein
MEAALKCAAPQPTKGLHKLWVKKEFLPSVPMAKSETSISSSAAATRHRTTSDEIRNGMVGAFDRQDWDVTPGGSRPLD